MKKLLSRFSALVLSLIMVFALSACSSTNTASNSEDKPKPIEKEMEPYYVDADWLKDNINDVIVVDASVDKVYKNKHIPGAINITWQSLSNMNVKQGEKDWGVILPKDELEKKIGSFGIDGSKTIIVYNDPKGLGEEGRVLWMLRVAGIENAKMLNGGLPAWIKAGGETTKEVPEVKPAEFKIEKYDDSLIATTDYVKNNLGKIKLVDTRSLEEYEGKTNHGENYKGEKALGRIPGAMHLHYQDLYNVDGTIKSISELQEVFTKLGLKPEDEIVTYCTVGIRSGFTAEILKMAGYSNVKNYNGSFSEWAGSGLEIEK